MLLPIIEEGGEKAAFTAISTGFEKTDQRSTTSDSTLCGGVS